MAPQASLSEVQKLVDEIASLRDQLSAKEAVISKLEFEIERLRKIIFGKKSERFISTDPNVRQLDIFGDKLALEVDGVRGDYHRPPAEGVEDSWSQVSDRLPDPGPGLDEQMLFMKKSIRNSLRHPHLLLPVLISLAQPGKPPPRPQQLGDTLPHNPTIVPNRRLRVKGG